MSKKKALRMAAAAADKVLAAMPVTKAAGGTPDLASRDFLIGFALPFTEKLVAGSKVMKASAQAGPVIEKALEQSRQASEQSRLALERCEAMYASMTAFGVQQRAMRDVNLSHFPEAVSENKSNGHHKPAEHYGSVN